ncbi:MAG: hypothetical protein R3E54_02965 [Halioglobus sp.]
MASGPLTSQDIDRATQRDGLLTLYYTCTQSIADRVCADRPKFSAVERLLTRYFRAFDPLRMPTQGEWLNAVVTPAAFPGPLQESVAVGPDGCAGYRVNAKLHRLREEQQPY